MINVILPKVYVGTDYVLCSVFVICSTNFVHFVRMLPSNSYLHIRRHKQLLFVVRVEMFFESK